MPKDFTTIVLISGRGSNLKTLIEQRHNFEISAVVTDKPDAFGLTYAKEAKIPTFSFPRNSYPTLREQKLAIYSAIRERKPDLICLAGFMQIVAPEFTKEFEGRIVNIHPSLLPDLPGLHTHQRAIDEKRKAHGCTVHFVDSGVDTGAIVAQAAVEVLPNDTEETLSSRVLTREHKIYPWVINNIAAGEIRYSAGKVIYSERVKVEAARENFTLS